MEHDLAARAYTRRTAALQEHAARICTLLPSATGDEDFTASAAGTPRSDNDMSTITPTGSRSNRNSAATVIAIGGGDIDGPRTSITSGLARCQ